MTRGGAGRGRTTAGLAGVLLGALLLTGCTTGDDDPAVAPATPPPTLEAKWSIEGLNSNPDAVGKHHYMSYQSSTSGIGRGGMITSAGPTLMVDTRTGRTRAPNVEPERFPCLMPALISDDGTVPIFWSSYDQGPDGSSRTEDCTRITALSSKTGKALWRDESLDLSGLAAERVVGADERTVAVVDERGKARCFAADTGTPQTGDDEGCVELTERLTHADLPPLVDAKGKAAPLTALGSYGDPEVVEIGRTDEVLLVRAQNHLLENGGITQYRWLVRAHDLKTGETLWEDDDLTPDPHEGDAWDRVETYSVTPSGVVRVSYEHPEEDDEVSKTPMMVTAVDPLTGKDLRPIARTDGAWFNHQFGDVLVALTEQQLGLNSTISGFELPSW